MNDSSIAPASGLRARPRRDSFALKTIQDQRSVAKTQLQELNATRAAEGNAVGTHIAEARTAGLIADDTFRHADAKLPTGWSRVQSSLRDDLKDAGAEYLQSPTGAKYIAFSKAAAKADVAGRLAETIGMPSKTAAAANSIGLRMVNITDVTYAGAGRGGALAKLAAESASFEKGKRTVELQPKLCVAINAQSISPKVYQSFGLNSKTFTRSTLSVDYTSDAKDRIKIGQSLHRDPNAYSAKTRAAQDVMSNAAQTRNVYLTNRTGVPNTNPGSQPKAPSGEQINKAREVLKNVDQRTGTEGIVKIPKSMVAQDNRIGAAAQHAVSAFTSEVVRQRLTHAAAPLRDYDRSQVQSRGAVDRGR